MISPRRLALLALLLALAASGLARADGEISVRGIYYKEPATRVVQPMLDARFDLDDDTEVTAHTLVDAITSASAAAGAAGEAFTERRYELGLGIARGFADDTRCGLAARGSYEPDYQSVFGSLRCQIELAQKNTTLGLALALGHDRLSNAGAQDELAQATSIEGTLRSALMSASLSQIVSPVALFSLTYDLIYLEGTLANPYRQVPVGGGQGQLLPERVPSSRLRHALFASARGFVPTTRSTWVVGYRFYTDDWALAAHTPELRLIQEIRPALDVHAHYRYHWQREASFYRDRYAMSDPYLTSDVKLSGFHVHTVGIELESALYHLGVDGRLAEARVDVVAQYVLQRNRLGNALVLQTALSIPFEY